LLSSAFPVYVTGAVLEPGKVLSDHPITVLEAIMERGGFDYSKANLKSVEVLRQEGGVLKSYNLNLKAVMDGKPVEQFFLRPSDIIYVREKFQWF
jgi:protein involved in polysaccharide export with SLBB domain